MWPCPDDVPLSSKAVFSHQHTIAFVATMVCAGSYVLMSLGSPMPRSVGIWEVLAGTGLTVGSLMLVVVGFLIGSFRQFDVRLVLCMFGYLIAIPLLTGLTNANEVTNILRDVIPLLFLGIPVLAYIALRFFPETAVIVLVAIIVAGVIYSARYLYGIQELWGLVPKYLSWMAQYLVGSTSADIQPGSIEVQQVMVRAQTPSILFSTIFLICLLCRELLQSRKSLIIISLTLTLSLLTYSALLIVHSRAAVVLSLLAVTAFIALPVARRGVRGWFTLVAVFGLLILIFHSYLFEGFTNLLIKHEQVGTNGKLEEWIAVLRIIGEDWKIGLFGIGWGGMFANPVYGIETRFTHSVVSFYLLKTGLLGTLTLFTLLIVMFREMPGPREIFGSEGTAMLFLAGATALSIGFFLQPTYKMLGFGMVLSLLLMTLQRDSQIKRMLVLGRSGG